MMNPIQITFLYYAKILPGFLILYIFFNDHFMGQTSYSTISPIKSKADFHSDYTYLKVEDNITFGKINVFQNTKSKQLILSKSILVKDRKELFALKCIRYFKQKIEKCIKRMSIGHPNLFQMIFYYIEHQNHLCGQTITVTVYFDYYPYTLENEIITRQKVPHLIKLSTRHRSISTKTRFGSCSTKFQKSCCTSKGSTSSMATFILRISTSTVKASQNYQQHTFCHIPRKVTSSQMNIQTSSDMHKDKQPFFLHRFSHLLIYHFKQLEWLNVRDKSKNHDVDRSDIFSLGMTILYMCTLQDSAQCYQEGRICNDVLNSLVHEVSQTYSQFLVKTLLEMLQMDETLRPSPNDLQVTLLPYENAIISLQPFRPEQQFPNHNRLHSQGNEPNLESNHIISLQTLPLVTSIDLNHLKPKLCQTTKHATSKGKKAFHITTPSQEQLKQMLNSPQCTIIKPTLRNCNQTRQTGSAGAKQLSVQVVPQSKEQFPVRVGH